MEQHLQSLGYPYLGVTLNLGGEWPVIELWDDRAEHIRLIAVCVNGASLPEALSFARRLADECEYPATAHAMSEYRVMHDDEPIEEG
jgi:hypothetical protein